MIKIDNSQLENGLKKSCRLRKSKGQKNMTNSKIKIIIKIKKNINSRIRDDLKMKTTSIMTSKFKIRVQLAPAVGVQVGWRSGSRLATTLVAT